MDSKDTQTQEELPQPPIEENKIDLHNKQIYMIKALGLELIQSKLNVIHTLSKQYHDLQTPNHVLEEHQERNVKRLKIEHQLQVHIDDLFDAFKDIQILALELNIKGLIPNSEAVNSLQKKLWDEVFDLMENLSFAQDQAIQVDMENVENELPNNHY